MGSRRQRRVYTRSGVRRALQHREELGRSRAAAAWVRSKSRLARGNDDAGMRRGWGGDSIPVELGLGVMLCCRDFGLLVYYIGPGTGPSLLTVPGRAARRVWRAAQARSYMSVLAVLGPGKKNIRLFWTKTILPMAAPLGESGLIFRAGLGPCCMGHLCSFIV